MILKLFTERQLVEKYGRLLPEGIKPTIPMLTAAMQFNKIKFKKHNDRYVVYE